MKKYYAIINVNPILLPSNKNITSSSYVGPPPPPPPVGFLKM